MNWIPARISELMLNDSMYELPLQVAGLTATGGAGHRSG